MKIAEQPLERSFSPANTAYPAFSRLLLVSLFVAAYVYFVVATYHWPILWDGQVLHYINFLIKHGMAPYREIYDMNLPGAYLIDGWQMRLFGPGDLAWRLYDFFLLGAIIVAMIVITLPYDWLAGLIAGVLFALFHAADGPGNAAQRDEIVTMLLLTGSAFLFQAVRSHRAWLLLPVGACMGLAISVKPTALPFAFALILTTLYVLKREERPIAGYLAYAILGFAIPAAVVLGFLQRWHAVGPLIDLSRRLTAFYATLMPVSKLGLFLSSLPLSVFALVPLGLILTWMNRNQATWEHWAIRLGIVFGFASYYLQNKGFKYHRYPFLAFVLLWLCMEFTQAIRTQKQSSRTLGWVGLFFAAFVMLPLGIYHIRIIRYSDEYALNLQSDLTKLGGANLQRQVQCLDMVDGCFSALYRLGIVQNTGFTGDTLFFVPQSAPAVEHERQIFWQGLQTNPPKVFVLSDEWFNWPRGFSKINHWPEFATYLNSFYTPVQTRTFQDSAYRIYVRKE